MNFKKFLVAIDMTTNFDINTGTQFNFSYGAGVNHDQMIGFEIAGMIWQSYLGDSVTVNIHVEGVAQTELGAGVIGGAIPGVINNQSYASWKSSFIKDKTSANDNLATSNLSNDANQFTALVDGYKVDNNRYMNINRANAKSLGLIAGDDSSLDGVIVMSDLAGSDLNWYYSHKAGNETTTASTTTNKRGKTTTTTTSVNTPSSTQLDFISVAIHEIGHVLGFVSGMDQPGWLTKKLTSDKEDFYEDLQGALGNTNPIDLFRYSPESVYKAGTRDRWFDLSVGNSTWYTPSKTTVSNLPYISVDGGKSLIANFATGANTALGGDGAQGSHWKLNASNPMGIMDPQLNPGQTRNISTVDLIAMDLMGWNIKSGTQVLNTNNNSLTSLTTLEARNPNAPELKNTNYQPVTWNATQYQLQKGWTSTSSLVSEAQSRLPGITVNRDTEIGNMIDNSQIYEWTRGKTRYWQMTGVLHQTVDSIAQDSPTTGSEFNFNQNSITQPGSEELQVVSVGQGTEVDALGSSNKKNSKISTFTKENFNHQSRPNSDLLTGNEIPSTLASCQFLPGSFQNELLVEIF